MNLDIVLCASIGQDLTMGSCGIPSHFHQAVSHHPLVSSSDCLHCAHALLPLLLLHLTTTYLLIQVRPRPLGFWGHLQSSVPHPGHGAPRRGTLSQGLLTQTLWYLTVGCPMWCEPDPGPRVHFFLLACVSGFRYITIKQYTYGFYVLNFCSSLMHHNFVSHSFTSLRMSYSWSH